MTPVRSRARPTESKQALPAPPAAPELAYLYGVAPSSAFIPAGLIGVAGPASGIKLVHHRRIAAITSAVPDRPLGVPADLRAHAKVLESLSALVPVLPMRFGGVIADQDVVPELLAPHHDQFAARLDLLKGHDQFTIKGRYLGDTALREAVLTQPDALRLLEALRGTDSAVYPGQRIRLGELVARGLDRQRAADTRRLIETLAPHATAVAEPAQAGPTSAVQASFLVGRSRRPEFERAAEELGMHWDGRIRLRLLGPLAPFDFAQPWTAGG